MWLPTDLDEDGPRFLAIVRALEADIDHGRIAAGERLYPQRELAWRLGLSVGTVARAYTVAEQRGLVVGEVGRGTYVAGPQQREAAAFFGDGAVSPQALSPQALSPQAVARVSIDLSLNVPPLGTHAERFGQLLRGLGSASGLGELLRYGPHRGAADHRGAVADWIARTAGFRPDPERVVVFHGAQHAMAVAVAGLTAPGDVVLTEALTYPGIKAAAGFARVQLCGVEMDDRGLVPEDLDAACERTGARLLYTMPTLHNPTGITLSEDRRHAIAAVARRHGLTILEDDVYGFLAADPLPPLAALLPEQTCYLGSFSKSMAPGLRIGFAVAPAQAVERLVAGIRATTWMTAPVLVEAVARWIRDGSADLMAAEKRAEAALRARIARESLGPWCAPGADPDAPAFHLWLRMPPHLDAEEFVSRAAASGVIVTAPGPMSVGSREANGVRICLGAAHGRSELREAVQRLRRILEPDVDSNRFAPSVI